MNGIDRALTTLVAAGATGALMWLAAQFDSTTTGGYWAMLGLIAGGGLLVGLAQLRGDGNPAAMFFLAFVPVLVCGGWILVAAQPAAHMNWFSRHVGAWSGDIGIGNVVAAPAQFLGVLAFGIGLTLGLTLLPSFARRRVVVAEAVVAEPIDAAVADEPTLREREEAAAGEDTRISRTPTRTVSR